MEDPSIFNPKSLCDPAWARSGTFNMLYVEAYELALAPAHVPRRNFRFDDIVVAIKTAKLKYLELAGIKVKFDEKRKLHLNADHRTSVSELSPKLITVQPYASANKDGLKKLSERSDECVSLLVATNYRNIAFRQLFTQTIGISDNSIAMSSDAFRLPFDLPRPDLSATALSRFQRSHEHLDKYPPEKKRKILLSLRWHLKSIQSDGVDCFLNLWIALETLSMNTSNISDMNKLLAAAYSITQPEAAATFGIGRIYGLRCNIVHSGSRQTISTNLTDYMECLYSDLLQYTLLGAIQNRSKRYIAEHGIDIVKLTSS